MELYKTLTDFVGKNKETFWVGVVEDNNDPMTLGRVKVRIFGIHPEDNTLVKTEHLPWATVLQPAISASTSGVGWSPNGLERSSWVFGMFLDGELGQYPLVFGSIPGIHRGEAPGGFGAAGSGYLDGKAKGDYSATEPFHGQGQETGTPGTGLPNTTQGGNSIRDTGERLTLGSVSNWPLKYYTHKKAGGNGLACRGTGKLDIHKSTALALEQLTEQWGKGALTINSAYRSPEYNKQVGGAKTSQHKEGRAFDINLDKIGTSKEALIRFGQLAVKNGFTGFGIYWHLNFIHIDTGTGRTWLAASEPWFKNAIRQAGWREGKAGLQGVKVDSSNPNPPAGTRGIGSDAVADKTITGTSSGGIGSDAVSGDTASSSLAPVINNNTTGITGNVTAYGPGYDPYMEGGIESSRRGPDGQAIVRTLEDVRTGKSAYVTLAGNRAFYGREYTIPSIQYDYQGQRHTLVNVRAVVHDTGSAFKGAPEGRFDIPVAQYMSWGQLSRQPFSGKTITFIPGANSQGTTSSSMPGFHDPTNSLPYAQYRGKPSTHENARGWNSDRRMDYTKRETGGHSGYPAAGGKGTFGEPASPFAPQYPYNKTYSTKSGHIMEFDDTPNAERVNIMHKSGTKWEISAKGSAVMKIAGNNYHFVTGNSYFGCQGDTHITSVGDLSMRSTADLTIHSDGSLTELVYGDKSSAISGKFDILVGGVLQIKASKILLESTDIDIFSTGNIKMEAAGSIDIKAGGALAVSGAGGVGIQGPTVNIDDVIHMAEGAATPAKGAASTDLGKTAPKKTIEKQQSPSSSFDIYTTAEDAADHYST